MYVDTWIDPQGNPRQNTETTKAQVYLVFSTERQEKGGPRRSRDTQAGEGQHTHNGETVIGLNRGR